MACSKYGVEALVAGIHTIDERMAVRVVILYTRVGIFRSNGV